jgi:coproporphyrinogen III oxidase-like Fe-S oxidoreductase
MGTSLHAKPLTIHEYQKHKKISTMDFGVESGKKIFEESMGMGTSESPRPSFIHSFLKTTMPNTYGLGAGAGGRLEAGASKIKKRLRHWEHGRLLGREVKASFIY